MCLGHPSIFSFVKFIFLILFIYFLEGMHFIGTSSKYQYTLWLIFTCLFFVEIIISYFCTIWFIFIGMIIYHVTIF